MIPMRERKDFIESRIPKRRERYLPNQAVIGSDGVRERVWKRGHTVTNDKPK